MAIMKKTKSIETEVTIITTEKFKQIRNYIYSIFNLINPNARQQNLVNPIGVLSAYNTLVELERELEPVELHYKDIEIERIFNNTYSNFTEEFILECTDNRIAYMNSEYEKFKSLEELEAIYPIEQRNARVLELESDISRLVEITAKMEKINKPLASQNYKEIDIKRAELNSLLETIEGLKTEEELKFKVFSYAEYQLQEVKSKVKEYREYLDQLLKEIEEQ